MKLSTAAIALTLAGVAGMAAQAPAMAQGFNPNSPLAFSSDGLDQNPETCVTRMTGRVEVTQGRSRLRADAATAQSPKRASGGCASIRQIEARGSVFYVTPERSVRADNANYNVGTQTIVFTGNVVAVQGQDVSTADSMTVNLDTNALTLSGRVRGVVYTDGNAE